MSRPKPTIALTDQTRREILEVCPCQSVYAVYYRDYPIKIRKRRVDAFSPNQKYSKTSFPEPGHAVALAKKLNQRFCTQDFSVRELRIGRVVPLI